jgi:hypothetical protein
MRQTINTILGLSVAMVGLVIATVRFGALIDGARECSNGAVYTPLFVYLLVRSWVEVALLGLLRLPTARATVAATLRTVSGRIRATPFGLLLSTWEIPAAAVLGALAWLSLLRCGRCTPANVGSCAAFFSVTVCGLFVALVCANYFRRTGRLPIAQ